MTHFYDLAEGLPTPKRLKKSFVPNYASFQPGSIIRCKLSNFMSYNLTEFHFGPKMNLIIGPNGSGKSTVVCAICIGLGGKLANLGKESMSTDNFIKDNQNLSSISIELKAFDDYPTESITITTQLIRNGKTQWMINENSVNEGEIKKVLKSYNIQLDNLCQFLPQDRVSKFADLKPDELLKEIERSYGDGELLNNHMSIIELQKLINSEKKKFDEFSNNLIELENKSNELKENVEKHKQFLKLQKELEKTEMIRPYVVYQEKKRQKDECKEEYETKKQEYKLFYENIKPLEVAMKIGDESLNEIKNLIRDCENKKLDFNSKFSKIDSKIEKIDKDIEKCFSEIKDYDNKLLTARADYKKFKEQCNKIREEIEILDTPDLDEIEEWKSKRSTIKNEVREFDDALTNIKSKINAYKNQIENIKYNIYEEQKKLNSTDRINQLDSRKYQVTLRAIKLLRQSKLHANFFEPALVTLNVNDKNVAPIVEALIPFQHLNAVVVPSRNDFSTLSNYLYDECKCMVSIRTIGNKFNYNNDRISHQDMIRLGFDGFVTDFLSGPEEVIQMLCENTYLHRIPVSIKGLTNQQKDIISDEISKGLNIIKYVSRDEIYTMNRSNFGRRQVTTNIRSFRLKSTIFVNGMSEEQKSRIHEKINSLVNQQGEVEKLILDEKSIYNEKNNEYKEKSLEQETIEDNIIRSNEVLKRAKKLQQNLEYQEDRLKAQKQLFKSLKNSNTNENKNKMYEIIEERIKEKVEIIGNDKRKLTIEKVNNDNELLRLEIRKIEEINKVESVENIHKSIESMIEDKQNELRHLKAKYKELDSIYKESISSYKKERSKYSDEEIIEIGNIIKEMAEENILTHEGLDGRIKQLKSNMELNDSHIGSTSIKKLEENEFKIEEYKIQIPIIEEKIKKSEEQLGEMILEWESELDKIVEIISEDFGNNMNKIASAGNVKLDKSDNDYSNWKLIIQVSFRDNEELTNFNGAQHSGGEKSTTTAVFLNSLQGLTNTPFRVVDEINQGMDAKNERKAHELIVKRATDNSIKGTSQYFLITPKLLSDLYYGPDMTVHCIFAGRWCPDVSSMESKDSFLQMGITQQYV